MFILLPPTPNASSPEHLPKAASQRNSPKRRFETSQGDLGAWSLLLLGQVERPNAYSAQVRRHFSSCCTTASELVLHFRASWRGRGGGASAGQQQPSEEGSSPALELQEIQ